MFDVWMGDVELTTVTLILSATVLLPLQLLLCFKVKSKLVRLVPVCLLALPTVLFAVLSVTATGWDALGYLFLALFAGFALLLCGVGWGIWGMIRLIKRKAV
ncbi:MAG: hypothetical protein IKU90_01575 [Clostridia bacterium]|nr:hypothetical protein [Clostridia bacterium]